MNIINIAGLMMNDENDKLEASIREKINPDFLKTIAPTPFLKATEDPNQSIQRGIQMVEEIIEKTGVPAILVGRSYGGFMAVMMACRMKFKNILKVFAIEAPLHPDVLVKPPVLLPPLLLCKSHYENRPALAREAAEFLKQSGTQKIVIIQGGCEDQVVPNTTQVFPENFENTISLSSKLGGVHASFRRPLPAGYRNHLDWSAEKMQVITTIIAKNLSNSQN